MKNFSFTGIMVLFILFGILSCNKKKADPEGLSSDDSLSEDSVIDMHKTRNLIIITIDGYRWQEVFKGADPYLINNRDYVKEENKRLNDLFWAPTKEKRRAKLMPFFWSYFVKHGKLYGNRKHGCRVNVANKYWFSYPGYSEIYTGYPDPTVNSNDFPNNPNINVLEYINKQEGFKNKVAAYAAWDAYYRILNRDRSGLHIVASSKDIDNTIDSSVLATSIYNGFKSDSAYIPVLGKFDPTNLKYYAAAKAYIIQNHPRVFALGLHDDHYGHSGKYDAYLEAAYNIDQLVKDFWHYLQTDEFYKGKTTLFITVDHGRGKKDDWKKHGASHPGSDQIWFAVMGPDTKPLGEIQKTIQLYQKQFATSFARFLGLNFNPTLQPVGAPIKELMDND